MEYGSSSWDSMLHIWASSRVWHSRGNSRVSVGLIHIFPGIPVRGPVVSPISLGRPDRHAWTYSRPGPEVHGREPSHLLGRPANSTLTEP